MSRLPAHSSDVVTPRAVDGLVVAPIARSPWVALRELRGAMADLQRRGLEPRVSWVLALDRLGRIVPGRAPGAAMFLLGYRLAAAV
jgi:hypothetical protein